MMGKGLLAILGSPSEDEADEKTLAFKALRKALKNDDDAAGAEALEDFISYCGHDSGDDESDEDSEYKPKGKSRGLFD